MNDSSSGIQADVAVLCGGQGLRLKAVTRDLPKPMVEVGGRPFLEILLKQIVSHGFRRIILCTGYRGEAIREYFRGYREAELEFSHEKEPMGTAGGLKLAGRHMCHKMVLVLNGDSYCDVNLKDLAAFHGQKKTRATLTVVSRDPGRRDTGSIELDGEGRILSFREKSEKPGPYVNAGIYALNREVTEKIPADRKVSLETEIFPALVKEMIYGFQCEKKLYDIGTPERLEAFRRAYVEQGMTS